MSASSCRKSSDSAETTGVKRRGRTSWWQAGIFPSRLLEHLDGLLLGLDLVHFSNTNRSPNGVEGRDARVRPHGVSIVPVFLAEDFLPQDVLHAEGRKHQRRVSVVDLLELDCGAKHSKDK